MTAPLLVQSERMFECGVPKLRLAYLRALHLMAAHPGELSAKRVAVTREALRRGIARFRIARAVHKRALAAVNQSFGRSRSLNPPASSGIRTEE